MKTISELENEIKAKIEELLCVKNEIQLNEDLTSVGLDSMVSVTLVVNLEELYNISFEDNELLTDNFSTINKIVELVQAKL